MQKNGIEYVPLDENGTFYFDEFITNYIKNEEHFILIHPYVDIASINGFVVEEITEFQEGYEWQFARNFVNNPESCTITDELIRFCLENLNNLPCAIIILVLISTKQFPVLQNKLQEIITIHGIPSFGLILYVDALFRVYLSYPEDESIRSSIAYSFSIIFSLGEYISNFGMFIDEFLPFFKEVVGDVQKAAQLFEQNNQMKLYESILHTYSKEKEDDQNKTEEWKIIILQLLFELLEINRHKGYYFCIYIELSFFI